MTRGISFLLTSLGGVLLHAAQALPFSPCLSSGLAIVNCLLALNRSVLSPVSCCACACPPSPVLFPMQVESNRVPSRRAALNSKVERISPLQNPCACVRFTPSCRKPASLTSTVLYNRTQVPEMRISVAREESVQDAGMRRDVFGASGRWVRVFVCSCVRLGCR